MPHPRQYEVFISAIVIDNANFIFRTVFISKMHLTMCTSVLSYTTCGLWDPLFLNYILSRYLFKTSTLLHSSRPIKRNPKLLSHYPFPSVKTPTTTLFHLAMKALALIPFFLHPSSLPLIIYFSSALSSFLFAPFSIETLTLYPPSLPYLYTFYLSSHLPPVPLPLSLPELTECP